MMTSAAATALNTASRRVPTSVAAVMITTEMRAAIRPYSMAVARGRHERERGSSS